MKPTDKKIEQARQELAQLRTNEPTPPDPDNMNEFRSDVAFEAVSFFMALTGTDAEDAVADLLGDLRHFADRHNMDYAAEDRRGQAHYAAEVWGEGNWLPIRDACTFSLSAAPEECSPYKELEPQDAEPILKRIHAGSTWAWCSVTVTCKWTDPRTLTEYEGHDYLGCCSYENAKDFKENSGYWEDMQKSAYDDLCDSILKAAKA